MGTNCPRCGALAKQGAPFCPNCGGTIIQSIPQAAPPRGDRAKLIVIAAIIISATALVAMMIIATIAPSMPTGSSNLKTSDTMAPTVEITVPSGSAYTTTASSIVLSGRTSDNVGVTKVTWYNMRTGTGNDCAGRDSWMSSSITLYTGSNTIVIKAYDASGNTREDRITVTYSGDGETDTSTGVVTMTPSSARPSIATNDYYEPEFGNKFVQIKLNITNEAKEEISLNPFYFELTASDGLKYDYTWKVDYSMADAVPIDGRAPVTIGFEIPEGTTPTKLEFSDWDADHDSSCTLTGVWKNIAIVPVERVTLGTPTYSVATSSNQFIQPDVGNRFIMVYVTITNQGSDSLTLISYYFTLSTSDGLEHDRAYGLDYNIPDGLQPGASYTVSIPFEISLTAHPTVLTFDDYDDVAIVNF